MLFCFGDFALVFSGMRSRMRFCIFGSNPMLWKEGLSWKSVFPKYYVLTYFLPKHKIVDPKISGCSNSPQRVLFGFISYSPTNDPPAFVFPLDFSPFINPFVVSLFSFGKNVMIILFHPCCRAYWKLCSICFFLLERFVLLIIVPPKFEICRFWLKTRHSTFVRKLLFLSFKTIEVLTFLDLKNWSQFQI